MVQAALGIAGADLHGKLTTAQVVAQWCRWVEYKAAVRDELPSCLQVFCLADQLEVIHVNTENQLELLVDEQALPSGDGLKVALQELVREVVLPVLPDMGCPYRDRRSWQTGLFIPFQDGLHWLSGSSTQVTM